MASNPYGFVADAGRSGSAAKKGRPTPTMGASVADAAPTKRPMSNPTLSAKGAAPLTMAASAESGRTRDPSSGDTGGKGQTNPTLGGSTSGLGQFNPQLPRYRDNPGDQADPFGYGSGGNPYGGAFDYNAYGDKNSQMARYVENTLPLAQLQQNSYQYGTDFNEAQRRWDIENQRLTGESEFGMGLQTRQQQASELELNRAWDLGNRQFGFDQEMGRGRLDLDTMAQNQNYELGQGRLNLDSRAQQQNFQIAQQTAEVDEMYKRGLISNQERELRLQELEQGRRFDLDTETQRAQTGIAQEANEIDRMFKAGQISNEQRQIRLAELTQRQNNIRDLRGQDIEMRLGMENINQQGYANRTERMLGQGSLEVQQQANRIDQMFKAGQISNQQREIALAELTQRQGNQLAQQRLGLDTQTQRGQLDIQREQNRIDSMFKTGQLSNEEYANATQRLQVQNQQTLGLRGQDIEMRLGMEGINQQGYANRTQRMLGQEANRIDQMFKSGQISNQQREIALAELTQQQNNLLGQRGLDIEQQLGTGRLGLDTQLGMGQLGIQQQATNIDQMYKTGQITNQQRELALAELSQQQQNTLNTQRLGLESQLGIGRLGLESQLGLGQLGLSTQQQQLDEAFRRYQLGQESQLAREQMQNQLLQARYAAGGRAAMPTTNFARQWA